MFSEVRSKMGSLVPKASISVGSGDGKKFQHVQFMAQIGHRQIYRAAQLNKLLPLLCQGRTNVYRTDANREVVYLQVVTEKLHQDPPSYIYNENNLNLVATSHAGSLVSFQHTIGVIKRLTLAKSFVLLMYQKLEICKLSESSFPFPNF